MAPSRASSLASIPLEHQNLRETHTRATSSPRRWAAGGGAGAAGLDDAPAGGGKQCEKGASAGGEAEVASERPRQICLARENGFQVKVYGKPFGCPFLLFLFSFTDPDGELVGDALTSYWLDVFEFTN